MGLIIDPKHVEEVEVEGEKFSIRTLTGRQRLKMLGRLEEIRKALAGREDEEEVTAEVAFAVQEANFEILSMGLTIDPDLVSPRAWGQLVAHVVRVNDLTGNDAKNSPSPSQ